MTSAVQLAICTLAIAAVAGCALPPTQASAGAPTVTVTAANGPVTVPVATDRIWALDEYAALDLLAVGVVPDHVANVFRADAALGIAERAGAAIVEPHNLELVAYARPGLIVGLPYSGHQAQLPQLQRIAPVVLLPEGVEESLPVVGAVTGRGREAKTIQQRIDAKFDDLAARIAASAHAGATYSVLSGTPEGTIFAYDYTDIFERVGLVRPPAQPDLRGVHPDTRYIQVSPERLGEHRADIVIALVDDYYTGGRSVLGDPLLDTRGSITAQVYYLAWSSPSPISVWWALRDLDAILFGNGRVATVHDAPAVWAEMTVEK